MLNLMQKLKKAVAGLVQELLWKTIGMEREIIWVSNYWQKHHKLPFWRT